MAVRGIIGGLSAASVDAVLGLDEILGVVSPQVSISDYYAGSPLFFVVMVGTYGLFKREPVAVPVRVRCCCAEHFYQIV